MVLMNIFAKQDRHAIVGNEHAHTGTEESSTDTCTLTCKTESQWKAAVLQHRELSTEILSYISLPLMLARIGVSNCVQVCHLGPLLTMPMNIYQFLETFLAVKTGRMLKGLFSFFFFCNPVAHHAPLSIVFPRQEHWNGFPFLSPGHLPNPGIEPVPPARAGSLFTTSHY